MNPAFTNFLDDFYTRSEASLKESNDRKKRPLMRPRHSNDESKKSKEQRKLRPCFKDTPKFPLFRSSNPTLPTNLHVKSMTSDSSTAGTNKPGKRPRLDDKEAAGHNQNSSTFDPPAKLLKLEPESKWVTNEVINVVQWLKQKEEKRWAKWRDFEGRSKSTGPIAKLYPDLVLLKDLKSGTK